MSDITPCPALDLRVERRIAAPPAVVWRAWTERLGDWWAPRPWTTPHWSVEARAGGRFRADMRSPDGLDMPGEGVILDAVPDTRIVFTSVLRQGWIPQPGELGFVGVFTFEADGDGTHYTATARHWSEEVMKRHEAMGFLQGWGVVAGQLAEIAEAMAG